MNIKHLFTSLFLCSVITACGGGGGGSNNDNPGTGTAAEPSFPASEYDTVIEKGEFIQFDADTFTGTTINNIWIDADDNANEFVIWDELTFNNDGSGVLESATDGDIDFNYEFLASDRVLKITYIGDDTSSTSYIFTTNYSTGTNEYDLCWMSQASIDAEAVCPSTLYPDVFVFGDERARQQVELLSNLAQDISTPVEELDDTFLADFDAFSTSNFLSKTIFDVYIGSEATAIVDNIYFSTFGHGAGDQTFQYQFAQNSKVIVVDFYDGGRFYVVNMDYNATLNVYNTCWIHEDDVQSTDRCGDANTINYYADDADTAEALRVIIQDAIDDALSNSGNQKTSSSKTYTPRNMPTGTPSFPVH